MASRAGTCAEQSTALPVFFITGCLGAGKTTLVKALLSKHDNVKGAILVCPFGENNDVDGALLRLQSGLQPRRVFSLTGDESDDEDDFNSVIKDEIVPMRKSIDLLLIESSGIADPRPMLAALGRMHGVKIEGVVGVVDATTFVRGDAATCRDVALRQVAVADIIVMTKTDLLKDEPAVDEVTKSILAARALHSMAAPAILRSTRDGGINLNELRHALSQRGVARPLAAEGKRIAGAKRQRICTEPPTANESAQEMGTEEYTSVVYCRPGRFQREAFERWAASLPPAVLRAKGLLRFSGVACPVEWQLLCDRSSDFEEVPDRLEADTNTSEAHGCIELVLIGRYGEGWEPLHFESGLNACLVKH